MELLHLAPETLNYHCPFNTSHTMPHKTLIKHLIRCPDRPSNFRNCIYNNSHVMPEAELKSHEENCPNRILFDTVVYESEDMVRPVPIIDNVPSIEYDESWDGLEQSADVLKSINKTKISMKAKHGFTKSERKKHRTSLHEHGAVTISERGGVHKTSHVHESEAKPLFIGKRPNNFLN